MPEDTDKSYGYYAPKHHVPAEGVVDPDQPLRMQWMSNRGATLTDAGMPHATPEHKEDD